jgi:hypothetical protein
MVGKFKHFVEVIYMEFGCLMKKNTMNSLICLSWPFQVCFQEKTSKDY